MGEELMQLSEKLEALENMINIASEISKVQNDSIELISQTYPIHISEINNALSELNKLTSLSTRAIHNCNSLIEGLMTKYDEIEIRITELENSHSRPHL